MLHEFAVLANYSIQDWFQVISLNYNSTLASPASLALLLRYKKFSGVHLLHVNSALLELFVLCTKAQSTGDARSLINMHRVLVWRFLYWRKLKHQ